MRYDEEFLNHKKALDSNLASGPECFTLKGPNLEKYHGLGEVSDVVQNWRIKFTW